MKERLSSFKQKESRDQVLNEINTSGDSPTWGIWFKFFWDLKSRIESGETFWITDLWTAVELHKGLEERFGSDTDLVLNRWRAAQEKQNLAQLDPQQL